MDYSSRSPIDIDPYALRHLAEHLLSAGRADELYELVAGPMWRQSVSRFDPSGRQYDADVRLAFRAVEEQVEVDLPPAEPLRLGHHLARMAALAWLSATLGYKASRIPVALIEALARLGEVDQAVQRAERIPDSIRQAEALGRSALAVYSTSSDRAYGLWIRARDLLREAPTALMNDKYETWANLITLLAQAGQTDTARSAAVELAIALDEEKARDGMIASSAFVGLTEAWGAIGDTDRAVNVVHTLSDTNQQILALCVAAKHLIGPKREHATILLDMAVSLAATTQDRSARQALAEHLAESGHWVEAQEVLGANTSPLQECRLLLNAAIGAFSENDAAVGQSFLQKGLAKLDSIDSKDEQARLLSDLIQQPHLSNSMTTELWKRLRELATEYRAQLSSDELARIGLGLARLGDQETAREIVSTGPSVLVPRDDWDEQEALIVFAQVSGAAHVTEGLAWGLERAQERSNTWQQAELAYSIAQAAQVNDDRKIMSDAERILLAAVADAHEGQLQPNAKGVLALWQEKNRDTAAALKTLDQALTQLHEADDLEGIAHLARTLAVFGDWDEGTRQALQRTLGLLKDAADPNVQARMLGLAAEATAALSDEGMWSDLKRAAASIDEDWLRAEALFWLAGWQARSGRYVEACQTYLDAIACELWLPVDPAGVNAALQEADLDKLAGVAASAGWPSTVAAAIFASLAVALHHHEGERDRFGTSARIELALSLVDEIPVEYSYVRARCYQVIVGWAKHVPDPRHAILQYWAAALTRNMQRDPGEVWAALGAGIPALYADLGPSFIKALWIELARVRDLMSQPSRL